MHVKNRILQTKILYIHNFMKYTCYSDSLILFVLNEKFAINNALQQKKKIEFRHFM